MSNLDPVTLTVIQNGLIQVCNEMDLAFVRSAFSPVISEGMDRSDGIYDAVDGSLIAQGELGLPVFVGTMQFSSRAVIDRVKSHYAGKVDPADVFIVNDPYLGGTHLQVVRQAIAKMRHRGERQRRAKISAIPDGVYEGTSQVDSDGVVDAPLTIKMKITKKGEDLLFDMTGSSPPCRGPMNSVIATTKSAIYLAVKHIFPEVPINAGTFEPLKIIEPEGTFLYAHYPRPVSGCAAEVSQRIAEAGFAPPPHANPHLLL